MAAKKKKTTAGAKSAAKPQARASHQLKSILCFSASVFLLCIVFIKGENIWTEIHNFFFGLFGVITFFYPFLLCSIAVLYALDKFSGAIKAKVIEVGVIAALVGAAVDIFGSSAAKVSFGSYLAAAYKSGTHLKNGGFFGALIGRPIVMAFGKTGAVITVLLLIFIFVMIITGTTLSALFRAVSRPVKSISEQAESALQARAERAESEKKHEFNVDIPVDDIPKKRPPKSADSSLGEKQRRVISTYNGEDAGEEHADTQGREEQAQPAGREIEEIADDTAETPIGSEDRGQLDMALEDAKEQSRQRTAPLPLSDAKSADGENNSDEVPFDAEKEKQDFAEKITGGIELEDDDSYKFPPLSLLKKSQYENSNNVADELDHTAEQLVATLKSFGVETRIVDICRGPTVTRYELQPLPGVKISKITGLADDIALNLASAGVRIQAPIPNKSAVGIEVPNKTSVTVGVREIIESSEFAASKSKLTIAMGRDIAGNVVIGDIAKMPHGLIAGATGSGKSVCINSIIMSILYKATPDEVKLLMIDPKVVELGVYNGIPHLLVPVVTEPRKAAGALGWAVSEMEKRYKMFADRDVRNIAGYNKLVETLTDEPEVQKMPHIVIIIDELADLMMTAPREVEDSINRIAAKARAAGMHLLIATQRPSVDVVTGVIKANIPTRIAFAVSSQTDSRTILDTGGAEKLLGKGDMLFSPAGSTKPARVQGCFVSDEEVESVVEYIKTGGKADYDDSIMDEIERQAAAEKQKNPISSDSEDDGDSDSMIDDAIRVVVENGMASTSLLQRKLKLGYARAARIIDQMEERGVIGPYEGSKPRKVLISKEQLLEKQAGEE